MNKLILTILCLSSVVVVNVCNAELYCKWDWYWAYVCSNKSKSNIKRINNCKEYCLDVFAWNVNEPSLVICFNRCELSNWRFNTKYK